MYRKGQTLKFDKKVLMLIKRLIADRFKTQETFCRLHSINLNTFRHKINQTRNKKGKVQNPIFMKEWESWFFFTTEKVWDWEGQSVYDKIKTKNKNLQETNYE